MSGQGKEEAITVRLDVVNTVNTELNRKYDFGVHAAGCQDVKRARQRYGVTVEHAEAESVAAYIASEEEQWAAQEQEGFYYKVFPCCTEAGQAKAFAALTGQQQQNYEEAKAAGADHVAALAAAKGGK